MAQTLPFVSFRLIVQSSLKIVQAGDVRWVRSNYTGLDTPTRYIRNQFTQEVSFNVYIVLRNLI